MQAINIVMKCGQKNYKVMCIIGSASASVYTILEKVWQSLMYFHETKPYWMFSKTEPDVNFTKGATRLFLPSYAGINKVKLLIRDGL